MVDMKNELIKRAESKELVFGIFGLGYVGLPLSKAIIEGGFKVIGFDIDEERTRSLNNGDSPISSLTDADLKKMQAHGFQATNKFEKVVSCDVIIICVPTPINSYREPVLDYVIATIDSVMPFARKGQVVSLESTTWPGTTSEVLRPKIEDRGFTLGEDFFLVYSPEREDPGNHLFTTKTIPKVAAGETENCKEVGVEIYSRFIDHVVTVSSTKTAEMVKLIENIHRSVNIGLVNELKKISAAMDINIHEAVDAAATKPFGFTPYYPGPGIGGHCIPIDPFYLTWKAREYGLHTRFIELAGEINAEMPSYVVNELGRMLNRRGKAMSTSKILCLGLTYKADLHDMRESPAVEVLNLIVNEGADVSYSDPLVPAFPPMKKYKHTLSSVSLSPSLIKSYDAILLLTDHADFDYGMILSSAKLILDTRGKFRKLYQSHQLEGKVFYA
ncbi:nucleotide sugar dehydrogenase [Alphaproteobacteria bacterium]|nr:nucleotide sugar dehydrogenase [Alphaproteobacteria bacterium]